MGPLEGKSVSSPAQRVASAPEPPNRSSPKEPASRPPAGAATRARRSRSGSERPRASSPPPPSWRKTGCASIVRAAFGGRLDFLFNNAGGPAPTGSITSMPVAGFDAAMALLVGSVMLGMKHAAPIMVWNRSGQHHQQRFDRMIYGAAKAAVNHLTRCVAMELGEHHVRVNSVSPGRLPRASSARRWAWERADADGATETFREIFAKAQPIPRAGILDDIAQCVLRLASDRSTFVNGTDIVIDGGVIGGRNYSQHHEGLDLVKAALGIKAP